jgi:GT2 family glycosyltransferase
VNPPSKHLNELSAELDKLRRTFVELRKEVCSKNESAARALLDDAQTRLLVLTSLVRSRQGGDRRTESKLDEALREIADLKARRADLTARIITRDRLLKQIQGSALWKAIKPIWKLFNETRRKIPLSTDIAFTLDFPREWKTAREILLVKGWCFSQSGRQLAGVRAKVGTKSKLGRYGLERRDVATQAREWPAALHSGFTIEVPVPAGKSKVRLEAIEQGGEWEPFFEQEVERKARQHELIEPQGKAPSREFSEPRQIDKLPPLSATKAFALLEPALRREGPTQREGQQPVVSVITPVFNSRPEWLAQAGLSLIGQSFQDWEWCLVDDGSTDAETRKLLDLLKDAGAKIQIHFGSNAGISAATNRGIDMARGRYVCFLDHDDILDPRALELMVARMEEGYDAAYSDEDKLNDETGRLIEPFFKPEWSPEYFRGVMYVGHLLCVETGLARRVRFDSSYDGVQDFEFMLRISETGARIGHVPEIIYHWRKTRGSVADKVDAKPQVPLLQERAVNSHLDRVSLPAKAIRSDLPHRLTIVPAPRQTSPKISIVIPTRDAPELIGPCLKSIYTESTYQNFDVVVMDNETTNEEALQVMRTFPIQQIAFTGSFNFSRAMNHGAEAATGEFLVFLNNDTEVLTKDWLERLLYYAEQPDIGAVGGLLLYPDGTVQHAGVALGVRGTADHVMRRFPCDVDGYAGSLRCAREVTAVTAACMMIRKAAFGEAGGFNEHYFTAYQDVDLCLRLRGLGLRMIYTPEAKLVHHESQSRRNYYDMVDRTLLLDQWENQISKGDPYYNRNLDLERGDYTLASS